MFVVAFAFFGAAIYLVWQWKQSQNMHSSSSTPSAWEDIDPSDSTFTPSEEVLNGNLDNIAEPAAWKIYKNGGMGFSLNVPRKVLGVDRCKNTKFEAPVVVLEDLNTSSVFIVPEYYYDKYTPGSTQVKDASGQITFVEDDPVNTGDPNLLDTDGDGVFDCRKKIYTLPLVRNGVTNGARADKIPLLGNPDLGVSLRTARIENTTSLNDFIQNVFGRGCALTKKEELPDQKGVYRLGISKTGAKDDRGKELACATDKVSDILYNPTKNRLAYAYLPEAGILFSDEAKIYDEDMIASVRLD